MDQITIGEVLVTSSGFTVSAATVLRRRGGESVRGDALQAALANAGFLPAEVLALRAKAGQRRADLAPPEMSIEVTVGVGESAVLLIEDADGALAWRLPDQSATAPARRGGTEQTLRFTVVTSRAGPADGRRSFLTDWLIDTVTQPIRVRVLKFLVKWTIDAALAHIESGLATGPVLLAGNDPARWTPTDITSLRARLPTNGVARVLLLVHGTFSSTAGSFAALKESPLLAHGYDLVMGFDHRTLGEDPVTNADQILASLHALGLARGSTIDAVAFSRGGLVYRCLVERLGASEKLGVTFDKAVFVGCTNAGTLLAEPDNWKALLDLYTNLLIAGASVATAVTGTAVVQPLIALPVKLLGGFAQMIAQVAITDRRVPGLAAMEPTGELVTALNAQALPAGFATSYYTVSTNYEPGAPTAGAISAAVLTVLDRLTDRLYGEDNDLVVPTASMDHFAPGTHALATQRLPTGSGAYHITYFAQAEVREALLRWLMPTAQFQQSQAMPPPDERRAVRQGKAGIDWDKLKPPPAGLDQILGQRSLDGFAESAAGATADASGDYDFARAIEEEPVAAEPEPGSEPAAEPAPADETQVERYLAAEMTPYPRLGPPANVYVTISPDAILVADHAAAAATDHAVRLARAEPLTIELFPASNCEVIGPASAEVDLHGADEEVVKFKVRGLAAGTAELRVVARQGSRSVASFLLAPVFVAGTAAPLRVTATLADIVPPTKGHAVLRIYEFDGPDGLCLQFNLTSDDPEFADLQPMTIGRDTSLRELSAKVLKDIEEAWNLRTPGDEAVVYKSFLARITAAAKVRSEALIPEPFRRFLWKHRAAIDSIQVISSEPFIPWEVMYIADPDGQEHGGEGFFAEWGLTRWLHDAPLGRRRVPLAEGTAACVIPTYGTQGELKGAQEERAMLKARFPAMASVPATSLGVSAFLRTGASDCTLLHFACHGRTEQNAEIASELLMNPQANADGEPIADVLTWQMVRADADFGPGGGPLVFVNACQTGQQGAGIAGTAGFASAFLRPLSRRGAAAFIGALWSVDDQLATTFSAEVYAGLAAGKRLGAAVRDARQACKNGNDFTWLAYSVYAGG